MKLFIPHRGRVRGIEIRRTAGAPKISCQPNPRKLTGENGLAKQVQIALVVNLGRREASRRGMGGLVEKRRESLPALASFVNSL